MKAVTAVSALSALAHEHRLAVFRVLVQAGPEGLSAGTIAEKLDLVPSSLTFHTQALQRAGLIGRRRLSRQIFYAADFESMNALVGYLTENCCQEGQARGPVCQPVPVKPAKSLRRT